MIRSTLRSHVMRRLWNAGILVAISSSCHGLLDVSDPTLTRDQDLANASGANGKRLSAVGSFERIPYGNILTDVALFSDELSYDRNYQRDNTRNDQWDLDLRDSRSYESRHIGGSDPHLGPLDLVVTRTSIAISAVRQYAPDSLKGDFLAQLFALRGYAILQMAEDICPGFPINDVNVDGGPVYSQPYTNDAAATYAVTQLDSALANGKDSLQYVNFARVIKGRALLDLGQYSAAAAAVSAVPDTFNYKSEQTSAGNTTCNVFLFCDYYFWNVYGYPVGDREGGNGLLFVSDHDAVRVPTAYKRKRLVDTTVAEYTQTKYTAVADPIVLGSGIEARLIEAESALHNAGANWLTILNTLRAQIGLPPLEDPGTIDSRVDLLYHERAFWLFLTGRRLGDMRRLIRNYGRGPEVVFPTGPSPLGPTYSDGTAIPFSLVSQGEFNHNIITGCTTR